MARLSKFQGQAPASAGARRYQAGTTAETPDLLAATPAKRKRGRPAKDPRPSVSYSGPAPDSPTPAAAPVSEKKRGRPPKTPRLSPTQSGAAAADPQNPDTEPPVKRKRGRPSKSLKPSAAVVDEQPPQPNNYIEAHVAASPQDKSQDLRTIKQQPPPAPTAEDDQYTSADRDILQVIKRAVQCSDITDQELQQHLDEVSPGFWEHIRHIILRLRQHCQKQPVSNDKTLSTMPATQASDAAAQTTASNTQRPVTVVTEEEGDESDEGGTEEMTTGAETGNSVVDNILDQMILQGAARYVRDRTIA